MALFPEDDLRAISKVFGNSNYELTSSQMQDILEVCNISFEISELNKSEELFQAFKNQQLIDGNRGSVLAFLRTAMNPNRQGQDKDQLSRIIHGCRMMWARRAVSAGLTAFFEAVFRNGLEVDVGGSSGGTCRTVQGP